MSDLNDRDAFAHVDEALRTYPLTPPPLTLTPAVMARIRTLRPAPPRFRLAWIDYAVSLFASGMLGLAFVLWRSVPPQMIWRAKLQILLWQQLPGATVLWASLLSGLILTAAAFLVAMALFARRPLAGVLQIRAFVSRR